MANQQSNKVNTVTRKLAKSEKVSYGDPVVLHDTTKSQVVFVPIYIPRSTGSELSAKIVTYAKRQPPLDWIQKEEKSISLNADATRKLLEALSEHQVIASSGSDGKYICIRVENGSPDLTSFGPEALISAVSSLVSRRDLVEFFADNEVSAELVRALRTAVRVKELRTAMAELRNYLDSGEEREQIYQQWCERHSWAFGHAYLNRDAVRKISPGDNTDLLVPSVMTGFRDIIELKRPDMEVLRYDDSHRNYYFSNEASKAIGQCHRYLDVLHEEADRGLRDHREVVAYHPSATIVIGRSYGWDEEKIKALHGLNRRLHGITVITYDHLLAQGERLLEILDTELDSEIPTSPTDDEAGWDADDVTGWDDEIPF